MDLQFNQNVVKCLQCSAREYQTQEQTQEIRIPDGMPDIGVVLGCWGQVVIRGKEWRTDQVGVTGGIMAKILYLPEEGSQPQSVEAWLPFQMRWTIPATGQDGTLHIIPGLRSADARVLSARKLMVRTNVGIQMQALLPADFSVCQSEDLPEDVCVLKNEYRFTLPKEAGEKAFGLDEMLELPASEQKPEQVIHVSLLPQVLEQKVLADKLIFRGLCIVHVLYRTPDGQLCSRDFDVPFSQYADLGQEFEADATMLVLPLVTNLELEQTQDGQLHLKAGFSGQYIVFEQVIVAVCQDAYSPTRTVKPISDQLSVPTQMQRGMQTVTVQLDPHVDVMRPVDVVFWPEQPYVGREGDRFEAELGGTFQMLYYDPEGQLQASQSRWTDMAPLDIDTDNVTVSVQPMGKASYSTGMLCADLLMDTSSASAQTVEMLTALELGDPAEPDPARPSVVVTMAGSNTLWQIAKENGSTVDMIRTANNLTGDPTAGQILLIPVL